MPTPGCEVVVFDGVCVLCSGLVRYVVARDPSRRFRFAAMQSASGRALLRDHAMDAAEPVSLLLFDGTRAWKDSEAVLRIADRLGGAWRLASLARVLPLGARDRLYRAFARRRYRWFGKRDACFLPSAEAADRFLR